MDDVYTEYQINSHTTFSFSGEVCADSDYRRNVRFAHSIPSITVLEVYSDFSGVAQFWGSSFLTPNPTTSTYNNPEHHEALEVDGYELPDRNLLI